jgi:putative membrane protein
VHDHGGGAAGGVVDAVLALPLALALIAYGGGMVLQRRRGTPWPLHRGILWFAGVVAVAAGSIGPLASAAPSDFAVHMRSHLLVGMIAPLLLVTAAPVTLALRCLHVDVARRVSRLLRSRPARFVSMPIVAAVLNVGGLWILYGTPVFAAMQQNALLHLAVMVHVLAAGSLFTASIIPIDPAPHRAGFPLRAVVLVAALAGHGILAKVLYANPPAGVDASAAREGALLMYYGGDVVDAVIIVVLCAQWYRHAGRRLERGDRRDGAVPGSRRSAPAGH